MRKRLLILPITLLVLVLGAILTLAFIKTDFNQVELNNLESITVHFNNTNNNFKLQLDTEENKEVANKIVSLYKNGTNESVLVGLFSNLYSNNAQAKMQDVKSEALPVSNGATIVFHYKKDAQPVIKLNNKTYTDEANKKTDIEYFKVAIKVLEEDNYAKTTAYYVTNTDTPNESLYKVNYVANLSKLFDYISELKVLN